MLSTNRQCGNNMIKQKMRHRRDQKRSLLRMRHASWKKSKRADVTTSPGISAGGPNMYMQNNAFLCP